MPEEIRFGGLPYVTSREVMFTVSPPVSEPAQQFRTPPFTIDREVELGAIEHTRLRNSGITDDIIENSSDEWEHDPGRLIRDIRLPLYFHYVSKIWSHLPKVSWKTLDILNVDNIDQVRGDACKAFFVTMPEMSPVITDLNSFLKLGNHLPRDGSTLQEVWFGDVYRFKLPFLCMVNKDYRATPTEQIEYKYWADPFGILCFIHSLMLWSPQDIPELREGAPFRNQIKDGFSVGFSRRMCTYSQFPCLVVDGNQGHAIEILYWNSKTRKFVYFDPWPNRTWLNISEPRAQPSDVVTDVIGDLWEISVDTLARCLFAVLIPFRIMDIDFLQYGTEDKFFLIPYDKK